MFEPEREFEVFEEFDPYDLDSDEDERVCEADFGDVGEENSGAYEFDHRFLDGDDEYD